MRIHHRSCGLFPGVITAAFAALAMGGCTAQNRIPLPADPVMTDSAQSIADMEAAIVMLQDFSRTGDVEMRAHVMEAVQPLMDPRAVAILEAGLRDNGIMVRFTAALVVGKRREFSLLPELRRLLADEQDVNVKVAMIYALRRMDDASQMQGLMHALISPDVNVRANTVLVLGLLGDRSIMPILKRLPENDARVRFEITAALARLGDKESTDAITAMALSKVAEDQWNAMQVCADLPDLVATSALHVGLETDRDVAGGSRLENARRNLMAARGLGKKGIADGGPWVLHFFTDPDPGLRGYAALAAGDIYRRGQEKPLVPLLSDPDSYVRASAAAGIVAMQSR